MDSEDLPWKTESLKWWDIVGMNHYYVKGEKFLYVAMMSKITPSLCIKAEGNEYEVFDNLESQAKQMKEESLKDKYEKIDYWGCTCGFRVLEAEYRLLKFNPFCRCGKSFEQLKPVMKEENNDK